MDKLAVFVEGYTEVLFVEKLIEEIAGENKVRIEHRKIRGGTSARRTSAIVKAAKPDTGQEYYVLIYDCGGDESVKPRIVEEYTNLANASYKKIIGLRDVRPNYTHAQIAKLEAMLPKCVKTKPIVVDFILSIMEIEAWILAEYTHFSRIDPAITVDAIIATLHFDPEKDDMQLRLAPADDLRSCYAIGGKAYEKHNAQSTVDALDYGLMYLGVSEKVPHLKRLVSAIEKFLVG